MTDLARSCAYRVLWGRLVIAQLSLFIENFFYIYKYYKPDKPSSLSFIQFSLVSNRSIIFCENATDDKNYPYLISSEKNCFGIFTQMKQINVV